MFKNNKSYRLVPIAVAIIVVLAISLGLNYHKDLIQYYNVKTLISENLDGRLVPHRVNDIDKLMAILDNGIQSLEVDLTFRKVEGKCFFEVGHGINDLSGLAFDSFLNITAKHDMKKLWMDLKNVTEDDIENVLQELERLDSVYSIKSYAIIESSVLSSDFQQISRRGYHTSYYLPTERITGLLIKNDNDSLLKEAEILNDQIRNQEVLAVSFDLSIYPFVKNYLEPIIQDSIVYHTWGDDKLWEFNAIDKFQSRDYFKDIRVKTILYKYWGSGVF